jgi:hypothetical protein
MAGQVPWPITPRQYAPPRNQFAGSGVRRLRVAGSAGSCRKGRGSGAAVIGLQ